MPSSFLSICPHCQSKLKLKNPGLIGKKARCPSCQEPFVVKKAGSGRTKPKSKPKPKPEQEELDPWLNEDLDDFQSDSDWPPESSGEGDAPPPVQGVKKKRKRSASGGSRQTSRTASSAGLFAANPWLGWVIGGGIAGAIGTAVWAALIAYTASEWLIVAWIIGGFVGFGVRVGAIDDHEGNGPGSVAVAMTVLAILAGKFIGVQMLGDSSAALSETEEWAISDVADEIADEWDMEGREIQWPDWEDFTEEGTIREEYPEDLWAAAEERWATMPEAEREEYLSFYEEEFEVFAGIDLLFFFLAAITAFKVGSGLGFGDD